MIGLRNPDARTPPPGQLASSNLEIGSSHFGCVPTPQDAGDNSRINLSLSPPCGFIAAAVNLAMVPPTQRHRELVTDLAPESRRLREAQMVSV